MTSAREAEARPQTTNSDWQETDICGQYTSKLTCCKSCSYCRGQSQKKGISPDIVHHQLIKYGKDISCVNHEFCTKCHNCPSCCYRWTHRDKIASILGKYGQFLGRSKDHNSPQRRLYSLRLDITKSDKVIHHHKWLC